MAAEMTIVEGDSRDTVGVLRLQGRLEARSAQELLRRCRDMRSRGKARVVLNLSGVTFVASSGVGTLLALTEEFKDNGGAVQLAAPSEPVRSVVDLLNLTDFLSIFESEGNALQACGA